MMLTRLFVIDVPVIKNRDSNMSASSSESGIVQGPTMKRMIADLD